MFGFLYVPLGRLLYIVYLALILYGFSTFGTVMGVVMTLATLFNVFLYFKHPAARKEYHDLDQAANYGSGGGAAEDPPEDAATQL